MSDATRMLLAAPSHHGLDTAVLGEAIDTLAGNTLPKHLVIVDKVERSPAGKADYRWAKSVAEAGVPAG